MQQDGEEGDEDEDDAWVRQQLQKAGAASYTRALQQPSSSGAADRDYGLARAPTQAQAAVDPIAQAAAGGQTVMNSLRQGLRRLQEKQQHVDRQQQQTKVNLADALQVWSSAESCLLNVVVLFLQGHRSGVLCRIDSIVPSFDNRLSHSWRPMWRQLRRSTHTCKRRVASLRTCATCSRCAVGIWVQNSKRFSVIGSYLRVKLSSGMDTQHVDRILVHAQAKSPIVEVLEERLMKAAEDRADAAASAADADDREELEAAQVCACHSCCRHTEQAESSCRRSQSNDRM